MGEREGSRWKDGGEEMERGGREKGGERRRMQGRGGMDKSGQQQSWSRTFTQFKSRSDDWKWKRFDQRIRGFPVQCPDHCALQAAT